MSPAATVSWWRQFNGEFRNFDLPSTEALIWAIQEGYSHTAQHSRYRKKDNFICGQHVGLDFDTGDRRSSLSELLKNNFINENASFLHTTESHTKTSPRGRVIFILERPIFSRDKYSLLTEAFAHTFSTTGGADSSCRDPVRLFFGSEKCEVTQLNHVLSLNKAATVISTYKETNMPQRKPVMLQQPNKLIGNSDFVLNNLLDKVSNAPDGTKYNTLKDVSRAFGGYIGAGYFDKESIRHLLLDAISSRADNLAIAANTISWGLSVGQQDPIYLEEDLDPILRKAFL